MTNQGIPSAANQNTAPGARSFAQILQSLWTDLWRYKLVIPAVATVVAGTVIFRTSREPRVYQASATLEYDPHPAQPLGSAIEDTAGGDSNYWNTFEFYETQNFILKSRGIAERVVRRLGLQNDPEFLGYDKNAPAGTVKPMSVEQAAQNVIGMLKVSQLPDTRIVRISVESTSPDQAQLIANAVVDAYIEKSLEDRLGTSSRALEWLGSQMENLKHELETSEMALYKYREEHQSLSSSLEERQKNIASQLATYTNTLTMLRTQRIQTEARLSVLREILSAADTDILNAQAGPIADDQTVEGLRDRYRETAATLDKLSVVYGANHPLVLTARAELEAASKQVREAIQSIANGIDADLRELVRSEQGIMQALVQVNQQGLELSLQETEYTRLAREKQSKNDLYAVVMERAAQTDLTRALRVANARIVDRALRPSFAIRPKVRNAVIAGVILGLMLGIMAALGVAQLDNKVSGVADLETRGVTVLGLIPGVISMTASGPAGRKRRKQTKIESEDRDLIVHREPRSTVAECCRTIRTNLTFQSADKPFRTLAITSAMPRDGKTTISISLAITMAQSGRRVLLVDTDLRKPRLHRAFGLLSGAGVTSVIAGETPLDQAVQTTDVPGLTLLQCGPVPPNPSELLHTRRFQELIEQAREAYDIVVFDTPPLGAVTDPAIISNYVDGMILVIRARSTTRLGVDAALRQLRNVSAPIIGAVLNDVDLTEGVYSAYYNYYRGYYAEEDSNDNSASPGAARTSSG